MPKRTSNSNVYVIVARLGQGRGKWSYFSHEFTKREAIHEALKLSEHYGKINVKLFHSKYNKAKIRSDITQLNTKATA